MHKWITVFSCCLEPDESHMAGLSFGWTIIPAARMHARGNDDVVKVVSQTGCVVPTPYIPWNHSRCGAPIK